VLEQDNQGAVTPPSAEHQSGMQPANPGRRRLGLGLGAGVLMTVKSTPGMAAVVCTTPSGSLSKTFASHGKEIANCIGRSPGYWHNPENWAETGCNPNTLMFKTVFKCTGTFSALNSYGGAKMIDMLPPNKCDFDSQKVGAHLIATYLNIKSHKLQYINLPLILEIWRQYDLNRTYKVNAETLWTGEDIVNYLMKSMIQ
jgi:hypothetical protein